MNISEIYHSIQGEGLLQGTPSSFVRVSGCNLRCWFCDTPYASWRPEGEDRSVTEIVEAVLEHPTEHVVLTGGEPLLFSEMIPLTQQLHRLGKHITIETAGTLALGVTCDLMSISPKLANSDPTPQQAAKWAARHQRDRHRPNVMHHLLGQFTCQMKFVIDKPSDVSQVDQYLQEFPYVRPDQIWLMPQGVELSELQAKEDWLQAECEHRGWHLCQRKHIQWFGNRRGV